jgi:hypothetical protein
MAIVLKADESYPTNSETEFPIGQEIVLVFDRAIDLKTAKESVIIYGPDSDVTSGPDNGLWLNQSDGTNPFFLTSPMFKGYVSCEYSTYLVNNLAELKVEDDQEIYEKSVGAKYSVLVITPKQPLRINTEYNLFICGESLNNIANIPAEIQAYSQSNCVSERTVYDAYTLVGGVKTGDARIKSSGSFEPKNNEVTASLNLKIVEAGNGSAAKFKWWFDDEVEPQPASSNYNSRLSRCVQRWRITDRGILIKFTGGEYLLNETFIVEANKEDLLSVSNLVTFSTGTESIFVYPEYTSTSPIAPDGLLIPNQQNEAVGAYLELASMQPSTGDINVDLNLNKIVLTFNNNIDATTATQENIKIESQSVSGIFDGPKSTRSGRPEKIYKIISVSDNKITLEF